MVEMFKGIVDLNNITLYYNGGFLTLHIDPVDPDPDLELEVYFFEKIVSPNIEEHNWNDDNIRVIGWTMFIENDFSWIKITETVEGVFENNFPPTDQIYWKQTEGNNFKVLDFLKKIKNNVM